MQILQTSTLPKHTLSSSNAISPLSLLPKLSAISVSLTHQRPSPSTLIRMGGGPRTYPGGVSKWQWKRMQAKKAKQLLKARLSRERQIYEMRKRAELKAAVSNLERPWEVVRNEGVASSSLFSVSADEQLKVLADRFQKPGGFDMWSENDGPQLFHTPEGLPSARFFPKGVVHSIKPYGRIDDPGSSRENSQIQDGNRRGIGGDSPKIDRKRRGKKSHGGDENGGKFREGQGEKPTSDKKKGNDVRGRNLGRVKRNLHGEDGVYDLSLQGDGSYGFNDNNEYVKN